MSNIRKSLTVEEARILLDKGTEAPFSGEYDNFYANGVYRCKQCNALLYRSMDKFNSGCGWPSFDDEIPGAIEKLPDADGRRTEIICHNCKGHLGHVFHGEYKTAKNTRHCVNSLSMQFVSIDKLLTDSVAKTQKLILAGGCFWGVEYFFERAPGVLATACGYTGGSMENPDYRSICSGQTGHAEAVAIIFDPTETNITQLLDLFFDIHNPLEKNRQGPDIGSQYRSALFPVDQEQEHIFTDYISKYNVKNQVVIATTVEAFE